MRILFVLHQFYPEFSGGTERVTLNLARMLQRAGHSVQVLACTFDPAKAGALVEEASDGRWWKTVHQGIPVMFLQRSELPATADISLDTDAELVDRIAARLQADRFDLVHVMHAMRMGSAVLAAQRCKIPYVVTLTDFFLPCAQVNLVNLQNRLCAGPDEGRRCAQDCVTAPWTDESYANRYKQARALLAGAGERVVPSGYVASRMRECFPGLQFRVIAHGMDLLALNGSSPQSPPEPSAKAPLKLVYVGSIIPQKGLDVVLKALALAPGLNVRLKVVGGFYGNSAYQDQIKGLAAADERVELAGIMDSQRVFQTLREMDLLCLPSRVPESFSLVVHEACAAGVPALVSDLGAPAEYVSDNQCGSVLPAADVGAWSKAIVEAAGNTAQRLQWRANLPLPLRVEEEAFFYESLYRRLKIEPLS